MLHFLPIIAVKGGRGNKGKLLAVPQYQSMTVETAYNLSACTRGEGEPLASTAPASTALASTALASTALGQLLNFCLPVTVFHSVFLQYTLPAIHLHLHLRTCDTCAAAQLAQGRIPSCGTRRGHLPQQGGGQGPQGTLQFQSCIVGVALSR